MLSPLLQAAAEAVSASSSPSSSSFESFVQPLLQGDFQFYLSRLSSSSFWPEAIFSLQPDPVHLMLEAISFVIIVYLLLRKPIDTRNIEKLTPKEQNELLESWEPIPLAPSMPSYVSLRTPLPVLESAIGTSVVLEGKTYLNFVSYDFLGFANEPRLKEVSRKTIEKYGVGSCGPRAFYGSFDVHLQLEKDLAAFLNSDRCIVYSDAVACLPSVIPAFAKRGDIIFADEMANFAIQQGLNLSRSNVVFFKHNDMEDLTRLLEEQAKRDRKSGRKTPVNRRFIVVEGLYNASGDIAPLDKIVQLKQKYKYRLVVDDSKAIGVLGKSGKGSLEYWGLKVNSSSSQKNEDQVDFLCGALDNSIGSVGGFCLARAGIIDHQVLSGAGYIFSASSPPFTAVAASEALRLLEEKPQKVLQLQQKAQRLRELLLEAHLKDFELSGGLNSSPIVHLFFLPLNLDGMEAAQRLYDLQKRLRDEDNILITVPEFIPQDKSTKRPGIRIIVTVDHEESELKRLVEALKKAINQ